MSDDFHAMLDLSGVRIDDELSRLLTEPELFEPDTEPTVAPRHAAPRAAVPLAGAVTERHVTRLEPMWVDPDDMEFTPQARPGKPVVSRLLSLVVRLCLLILLVWMVLPEMNFRFVHRGELQFDNGVLAAQPVQLSMTDIVRVTKLYIDPASQPNDIIPAGTRIAQVEHRDTSTTTSTASASSTTTTNTTTSYDDVIAPFDARFVSVDTPVGAVALAGQPIVTVYDPSRLRVIVTVTTGQLSVLKRGMPVELTNSQLGHSYRGKVDSAVPLLSNDHEPTTKKFVNVRIELTDPNARDLVPGSRFHVFVDLHGAPKDALPLVLSAPQGSAGGA